MEELVTRIEGVDLLRPDANIEARYITIIKPMRSNIFHFILNQ
jgi:hypothetical protein